MIGTMVTDWDDLREGDVLEFIGYDEGMSSAFVYTAGGLYSVGRNLSGHHGPLDEDNTAPSRNYCYNFKYHSRAPR